MPPTAPSSRLLVVPWGDVIEDYLGTAGISLEAFLGEMSGGWLFGYVDALTHAGYEVTLVCVSLGVKRPTRVIHTLTGASVRLLPPTRLWRIARGSAGSGSRRGRLAAYLSIPVVRFTTIMRRQEVRAVLCQEYESPRFDVVVVLGRLLNRAVFATFQGGTRQRTRIERWLRPRTLPLATGLIIGASLEEERIRRRYGRLPRIARIPNPADAAAWVPVPQRDARVALGLPADTPIACWHGRVSIAQKGLDTLVSAWSEVLSDIPGGLLLLLGDGHDAEALAQLLGPFSPTNVRWLREFSLDRDRVRTVLSAADVYAFPSRNEGFPAAPIEAMACGVPVVATDAPGARDVMGDTGVIVPRDDQIGFTRALSALLRDPAAAHDLGRRARRRVQEVFGAEVVGGQLRRFLDGVVP